MAKAPTGPKTVPRTSLNALSKDRKTVRKKRWTMRYRKRRKQDLLCRHRRVCSIDAADPRERTAWEWKCDGTATKTHDTHASQELGGLIGGSVTCHASVHVASDDGCFA
jgi:hypothetical protein